MPTADLNAVVDRAYTVFPAGRLSGLGVCNCGICMSDEAQSRVAGLERREISPNDLSEWYNAATSDSGLVPHKVAEHLAPKVFEMLARREEVCDTERALGPLALAKPDWWTPEQVDLIAAFRDAYVDRFRGDRAGIDPFLDDALCMFAIGGFDLAPILARSERWPV